jgi:succinate dehydrogenase / fumarate reductase cytochrome b subunit
MNLEQPDTGFKEQSKQYQVPFGKRLLHWFDPRGNGLGMAAFILNRITGIGLVVYLFLHLVVLSLLIAGEEYYNAFIRTAHSPIILTLDIILIAGMVIHGLNGVRVTLVGMGIGVRTQKTAFIALMALAAIVLIAASVKILDLTGL